MFGNAIGDGIADHVKPSTTTIPSSANSAASAQNGSTQSNGSATTGTAQGGSSNEATEALTNEKDPLSNPVLQPISVDLPPLSLPPITFTVGSEGLQEMWGESKSMLAAQGVTNPTNAQIEDMDQQLLSANPGVTTLQIGQQLNFPDGSTTAQGIQTYTAMNQNYEESQLQPIAVTAGLPLRHHKPQWPSTPPAVDTAT